MRRLIAAGADRTYEGAEIYRPFLSAVYNEKLKTAQYFLEEQGDAVDLQDGSKDGTALVLAAINDDLPMARLLLGYGVRLGSGRTSDGKRMKDLATNPVLKQLLARYKEA